MRIGGCRHVIATGMLATATVIASPAAAAGSCHADVDLDGDVDLTDLVSVLSLWGPCPGCSEDIDGDGLVGFQDLLQILFFWGPCPFAPPIAIDLAGNALTRYPHFEFVKAFNENAAIQVAIDPGHVPAGAGTADVYIVAAKTAEQWALGPALADVRGAPQTAEFSGANIQENTVTLEGGDALSGDGGMDLGVGYDVVCDFDRDGLLGDGDLIDGFGDEAGLYVVRDLTLPGPLAVSELTYNVAAGSVTPGYQGQNTFYPSDLAMMAPLPLIAISHGNGHQYTWYDYLMAHLASYGYVVMSHQNNTGPGIETASTTTWEHTDAFLGQLDTIGGGVLAGHVDASRIIWIGHSRGGEGVARAYTRVRDGLVQPVHYTADDIVLVSSIAPNNNLGPGQTEPYDVNYHLLWGAADGDISGSSTSSSTWSFAVYERAEGFRQATYVHGADHNDFNCCGFQDFDGPPETEIGRPEAQQVAKAVYLALVERYVEGNVPALDYLWRQHERIRPAGVAPTTTVVSDYREPADETGFVIDDFQTNPEPSQSSSGGAINFNVSHLTEDLMRDFGNGYSWTGTEPMNGMSRGVGADDPRGITFDWSPDSDRFLEFGIIGGQRDLTNHVYLSFRACQETQHPETVAELGDLSFTVTLVDMDEQTSSIAINAYGGGIQEVYQRADGWQNEMEVVRIRLIEFLHNDPGLDLGQVRAIRFQFGSSFGSARGRIGLDDLLLSRDAAPPRAGALAIGLPQGAPAVVAPDAPTVIPVTITAASEDLVPGSALFHYRLNGGSPFQTAPLDLVGGASYEAVLPAAGCADMPEFSFSAQGSESGDVHLPIGGPEERFEAGVGVIVDVFHDDFEADLGWTVENVNLEDGGWDRGVPVGGGDRGDPPTDFDGSGQCYLTDNEDGNSDVDGGPTILTSPAIDTGGLDDPYVSYARWFTNDDGDDDALLVEISADDGGSWATLENVTGNTGWIVASFRVADFVTPSGQVRLRFSAIDDTNNSVTEAAIDAVTVYSLVCE